jgi:hypothetical protein
MAPDNNVNTRRGTGGVKSTTLSNEELADIAKRVAEILAPTISQTVKEVVKEVLSALPNLQQQHKPMAYGQPPMLYSTIAQAKAQVDRLHQLSTDDSLQALFEKKKVYAVIERLEEEEDEAEDNNIMKECVEKVINADTFDLDKWYEVKRFGTKKQGGRPRIIKVKFGTQQAATKFIKTFRQQHKPEQGASSPFARRDLTPPELQLQNHLKQEVAKYNQENGPGSATYRYLKIFYKKT